MPCCWNCLASHLPQNQRFWQVETCINLYCQQINPKAEQVQINVLIFQKYISLLLKAPGIAYHDSLFIMQVTTQNINIAYTHAYMCVNVAFLKYTRLVSRVSYNMAHFTLLALEGVHHCQSRLAEKI